MKEIQQVRDALSIGLEMAHTIRNRAAGGREIDRSDMAIEWLENAQRSIEAINAKIINRPTPSSSEMSAPTECQCSTLGHLAPCSYCTNPDNDPDKEANENPT